MARIDELFGIDAQAREQNLDHAARHALRLERSKPLVEVIRGEVEAARDASLPSSALGKAAIITTRSRSGGSSRASWSIPSWS